jgi:uncharacterized lipoprotein YddW (UPF0748 family)
MRHLLRNFRSAMLAFAAAVLPSIVCAQAEMRGVWIARDGLTTRAKIVSTLDQMLAANINTVCVNVWSRGFTVHPSDVLFAACGQRQDPDYIGRDPLAEMIFEAHKRGMEVEAWMEYGFMFGWSGWFAGPTGVGPVLTANPTWIGRDNLGNTQVSDGGGGYFTWASHEHPAVRKFLIDMAVEIVDRYDVDAVQFDRCRYPSTSFGYDATTAAAYQAATGNAPPTNVNATAWKRWRADRLNAFHTDLYNAVKARRTTVRVTDAPTVWPGSYDNFLQDWPQWVTSGSIDLIYPQVYRTTLTSYVTTLDQQLAAVPTAQRSKIAPGIRAISGTPTADVLGMVAADRTRNLPGHVFWYAEGIYDDLPSLTTQYFASPAAIPGRPANWRPVPTVREENDPTTTSTGFNVLPTTGSNAGSAALASPTAPAGSRVRYTMPVGETGLWTVLVYVPTTGGYAATTPVTVANATGNEVATVSFASAANSGWREVGSYWLAQGSTTVDIGASPGFWTAADAVMLKRSRFASGSLNSGGTGTSGVAGPVTLALSGRASIAGALRVQAGAMLPNAPMLFCTGFTGTAAPLFGGTLYLVPDFNTFVLADAAGRANLNLSVPSSVVFRGLTILNQALALDAGAVEGVALSNAVSTVVQ